MIKLPHIVEKVFYEPWLITPAGYNSIRLLLESKLGVTTVEQEETVLGMKVPRVTATIDSDGIATIPINGILGSRISPIEKVCGAVDYLDIQKASLAAVKEGAKGVLYDFDSPGGMVRGCSDLAGFIKGLSVPTQAFTDAKCTSAAYWLASACNGITAAESSDVGSIGVILPWVDKSNLWEVAGLKYEPFVNVGADLKGAGAGPSLTDAQRKYIQETLDFVGKKFQSFISSNRPRVKAEVFRAGTYFGEQALGVGLVDSVGGYAQAHQALLARL
jgi:ClpP class serine protease